MLLLALSMVETAEEAAKLTRLYELYSTEMYHAAKNILRNHHDAEDAMQNAFVQLIRLLDHIKDPEAPVPGLMSSAPSRAGPPIYTATNSGAALCLWTSWRRCPFRRPRPMCLA